MQDTNQVVIIGRLTRDVELKYTSGGLAIASLSIASNRRAKQGEEWVDEASFFDVTYMGRGAEAVQQYLTKGKQVCVSGSLKQERWEKGGQRRSKVVIHASNVQLLGGRDAGSSSGSADDFESEVPF
jgi:single-strand DNA-binding protein